MLEIPCCFVKSQLVIVVVHKVDMVEEVCDCGIKVAVYISTPALLIGILKDKLGFLGQQQLIFSRRLSHLMVYVIGFQNEG